MDGSLTTLRERWLEACLRFHERDANRVLQTALGRYESPAVAREILLSGLAQIGDWWYEGRASVHQEHFAASQAMRQVELWLSRLPPPFRPERLLVFCPSQELHQFNLLLLTYFLRLEGWEVIYLGSDLPIAPLEQTLRHIEPHLVISGVVYLPAAATLFRLSQNLAGLGVKFAFGGRPFNVIPVLRQRIAGVFLGERLEETPQRLESLLQHWPLEVAVPSPAPPLPVERFRQREMAIRAGVWMTLVQEGQMDEGLLALGKDFNHHLEAALELDDELLMLHYLQWLAGYRGLGALPPGWLDRYVELYIAEAERWLGLTPEGQRIVTWLQRYRQGAGSA